MNDVVQIILNFILFILFLLMAFKTEDVCRWTHAKPNSQKIIKRAGYLGIGLEVFIAVMDIIGYFAGF